MRSPFRITILVLLVADVFLGASARAQTAGACDVAPSINPLRNEDIAKQEVTFAGQVQNHGTRTARVVVAKLKIVANPGDKVLGEAEATVTPSTLGPGETGRFKVTASNQGGKLVDVTVKEDLSFEASRCDAPDESATGAAAGGGAGSTTCEVIVSEPFDKKIDDQAHTVTFSGSVENRGSGTAKGIEVTGWVIGLDKLLAKRSETTTPPNLAPQEKGTFSVTVPLEPGQRSGLNDRVTAKAARCD